MYVLQPSTDEHGWQYRSVWSNGPITENDEQWVKYNSHGLDARRRLWITTVVRTDDQLTAKNKLSEAFKAKTRGVIVLGDLFRQEKATLRKVWVKRFVVLTDTKLEIYVSSGGKKIAELLLAECEIKMLFGVQCPGRDFAFSIRDHSGQLIGLFDAENREIRRRWVVAIRYQLAIHSPGVNFPPFDYGPPTGEEVASRVLMCGELQKQSHTSVKTWKNRFFQLTPVELQYYDKEELRGSILLVGAVINENEKSGPLDFSVEAEVDGKRLVMRADTQSHKTTWLRAIQRQVTSQNEKRRGDNSPRVDVAKQEQAAAGPPAPAPIPAPAPTRVSMHEAARLSVAAYEAAEKEISAPAEEVAPEEVAEVEEAVMEEPAPDDEVAELVRRYSQQLVAEAQSSDSAPVENTWEEPVVEETEEDLLQTEGGSRASIVIVNTRASMQARASMGMSAAPTAVEMKEAERLIEEEEAPETEDVFQGLEVTGDAPVNEGEEVVLTAAAPLPIEEEPPEEEAAVDEYEPEPVREPEPEATARTSFMRLSIGGAATPTAPTPAPAPAGRVSIPARPVSKREPAAPAAPSAPAVNKINELREHGRRIARRQVPINPDSQVGSVVYNLEKKSKRYI